MTDPADLSFDDWIIANACRIADAREVSVEDLKTEPGELSAQLSRVRQHFVSIGEVKADATSWVNKTKALAVQRVRKEYPDFNANERKAMVDADPDYIKALHIRGDIITTAAALKSMGFEIMNDRRTSFSPQHHNDD